jgi:hypothetical protein
MGRLKNLVDSMRNAAVSPFMAGAIFASIIFMSGGIYREYREYQKHQQWEKDFDAGNTPEQKSRTMYKGIIDYQQESYSALLEKQQGFYSDLLTQQRERLSKESKENCELMIENSILKDRIQRIKLGGWQAEAALMAPDLPLSKEAQ